MKWSFSMESLLILFLAPVTWNANIHPTSTFDFYSNIVFFSSTLCLDIQKRDTRVVAPLAIIICFIPLFFWEDVIQNNGKPVALTILIAFVTICPIVGHMNTMVEKNICSDISKYNNLPSELVWMYFCLILIWEHFWVWWI